MHPDLDLLVVAGRSLRKDDYAAVLDLCSLAFEEDYEPYLQTFDDPVHVLGTINGKLVSHALWITRWLEVEDGPLLRTAYVEGVATDAQFRGRGYATAVMQRLMAEIQDYDIGGLSPADTTLYSRLGWEFWQGPLFTRVKNGWQPDPEERVMILRLPATPDLDLHLPLSIEWREEEVW